MSTASVLYVTFPNRDEALRVARLLLDGRLVACANVIDRVTSLYWWEGAVHEDAEVVLIAKTATDRVAAAIDAVQAAHSYDCPCVTSWPITDAHPPYLDWIARETHPPAG